MRGASVEVTVVVKSLVMVDVTIDVDAGCVWTEVTVLAGSVLVMYVVSGMPAIVRSARVIIMAHTLHLGLRIVEVIVEVLGA